MASPITYFISPVEDYKKLKISFDDAPLYVEGTNPNDRHSSYGYSIDNLSGIHPRLNELPSDNEEVIRGIMSPTDNVSLPPYSRKRAGITSKASKFAFISPPPALAEYLSEIGLGQTSSDPNHISLQLCQFSVTGAFIYFDDRMNIVGVNVLSILETEYKLKLAGPFKSSLRAKRELVDLNRFGFMPLDFYHEAGVHQKAWVRPGELFQSEHASVKHSCAHGAFMFRTENNYSVTYAVTIDDKEITRNQTFEGFADVIVFGKSLDEGRDFFDMFKVNSTYLTNIDRQELRQRIRSVLQGRNSTSDGVRTKLLSEAIKANVPIQDIEKLLQLRSDDELLIPDSYGWTALHYACRFMADNECLVKILLERSPHSVLVPDKYNRFPLHLACDSHSPPNVINLLLQVDAAGLVIAEKTLHLQMTPLKLACNRMLPKETISALLDADVDGKTCRMKGRNGRNAMHIALERKSEADVVELLLQADTRLNNPDVSFNSDADDIYQSHRGLSPLHYACISDSNADIVRLLLRKDMRNITIFQTIGSAYGTSLMTGHLVGNDDLGSKESPKFAGKKRLNKKNGFFPSARSEFGLHALNGMRALHLALVGNSEETVRILLREEKQIQMSIEERTKFAKMYNVQGMTCLHLACLRNMGPDIIKLLLNLDPSRVSTTIRDDTLSTPMHLACNHKLANQETIRLLINAEIEHSRDTSKNGITSTSLRNINDRNPLSLAINSGAPTDVIKILLEPEYFDMTGMKLEIEKELARRVRRSMMLQKALNRMISNRSTFMWLLFNVVINWVALFSFTFTFYQAVIASDEVVDYELGFTFLCCCCATFCARELIQMFSQKTRYLVDSKNAFDFCNLLFLIVSINMFNNFNAETNAECNLTKVDKLVLGTSGVLLGINILISLRSIFLPFARFAGGINVIVVTLIPFFVTSYVVIHIFIQLYVIKYQSRENDDYQECDSSQSGNPQCACREHFSTCWTAITHGFFNGLDDVQGYLDIFFGLTVSTILLNVVIAIVSDSWQEAREQATLLFWRGRISFLSESALTSILSNFPAIQNFYKWVDETYYTTTLDISWERDHPYNMVHFKKQYDDPYYHFTPAIAKEIEEARCLTSDLHWIKADSSKKLKWESRMESLGALFKWFGRFLVYILLIILGIPTFGATWPKEVRIWLLSLGNSGTEEDEFHDKS